MNSIFLAYIAPPVVGAFIGYLTNKIAIRMLFRPLKQWRILGVGVPMTPGVIPSKRHELANNIGEMVGRHLLTSDDIGAALSDQRFQDHLHSLVDDRVHDLFHREFDTLYEVIPERFKTYFKVAIRTVKYQFRTGVNGYLQSDAFEERVVDTILMQLEEFGERELNELISMEERQAFYGFVDRLVESILASQAVEKWLAEYLKNYFKESAADGKTIADHLPEPLYNLIMEVICRHSPGILKQLAAMLAEPPVRERIIKAVRGGIDNFIDSLGMLGSMAGSFLDMNVLEEKVREYLVENDDKIADWLQNPEVQERFSSVLIEQTRKFLDTPLSSILEQADDAQVDSIFNEVAVQVVAILRAEGIKDAMSTMLQDRLEGILGHGKHSVSHISTQLLDPDTVKSLKLTMAEESVVMLRSQRVSKMLDRMLGNMLDSFLDRPIGILHNILPVGVRTGIVDYAILSLNRILIREVPGLVDQLNIRRIVSEKVDSLDLLKLEGLLLSIMQEQFKYINLFGALLGFLIGLLNLLVMRLV